MPNSQTLQLYLDLTQPQASQDGRFAANASGHPSKVWINQSGGPSGDAILNVKFTDQVAIYLQVTINMPAAWSYRTDQYGNCLRVTTVIGRNHHKTSNAVYDSPFTIGNVAPSSGGTVCTVFDQWYPSSQITSNSVTLPLGTPQLSSGVANGTDKYAFIVAVTLCVSDNTGAPKTYTAGHDPEMEIAM